MLPYLAMLLLPALLSQTKGARISLSLWVSVYLLFVLFVGLRFEVGPDWDQYGNIHNSLRNLSLWDVLIQSEPLSYSLFWLSQNSGFEMYLTNVFGAVVLLYGVFSFAARTVNPWLSIVAAAPYFVFVTGMSGVRQSIAAGIMLFLLSRWESLHMLKRAAYIVVAALFHTSALVNSIFLVTQLQIAFRYKFFLGGFILGLTFLIGSEVPFFANNMLKYQERYIDNIQGVESIGSLYHIAMILIPAFIGFRYRHRMVEYVHNRRLLQFGFYAAFLVLAINFLSSTAASRLTLYLYFVPMMVYPAMSVAFGEQSRKFFTTMIVLLHIVILLVWFTLGNHTHAYIPYRNAIFQ